MAVLTSRAADGEPESVSVSCARVQKNSTPGVDQVFFNDTATTEIYTLSLHDALPIWDATDPRVQHARHAQRHPADQQSRPEGVERFGHRPHSNVLTCISAGWLVYF